VSGVPEMIDHLVMDIPTPEAASGSCSQRALSPDTRSGLFGSGRNAAATGIPVTTRRWKAGCGPALLRYFNEAPRELFVKAEAKQ